MPTEGELTYGPGGRLRRCGRKSVMRGPGWAMQGDGTRATEPTPGPFISFRKAPVPRTPSAPPAGQPLGLEATGGARPQKPPLPCRIETAQSVFAFTAINALKTCMCLPTLAIHMSQHVNTRSWLITRFVGSCWSAGRWPSSRAARRHSCSLKRTDSRLRRNEGRGPRQREQREQWEAVDGRPGLRLRSR